MVDWIEPQGVAAPLGNYTHVVRHGPGRRLIISGQVGVTPDGEIAEGLEDQMRWAMKNLVACLKAGGMEVGDLVKIVTLCVPEGQVATGRMVRAEVLGEHKPASTWIEGVKLANPALLFEIEGEAVRED
ncbi:MAG: RidA family protein [Pseudomonadota bacterium]